MKGADKTSSGQGAQTVYRDKKGRKLDMLNEFMKQQDARAGKEVRRVDRTTETPDTEQKPPPYDL